MRWSLIGRMACAVLAALAGAVIVQTAAAQQAAPAFTGKELSALPRDGWITNGGNSWNQRYSPLDGINKSNVAGMKAVWRASLNGAGLNPRAGNQAQPIVYDGMIYIQTGEGDALAVSIDTGKVVWHWKANVDANLTRPCCGWDGRGVALGEGKIFVGTLDARMFALDQKTGKVIWQIQTEDPKARYVIAQAPLYYDGMVITGFAGSDGGIRGRVKAYDAKDGHLVWTFYTIPGPGEFGHDTWPQDSEVWTHGGAGMWQTPAVDPELGLLYFSTANPGPVLNGRLRKGDNLFSASILAIDAHTGKYRWHFQEVHHDMWDYDAPNPVILFDAPYKGKMRKGIAQAGKTGWVYILDRVTGKPLVGIVEKPVMQEPSQHTSKTQPYPIGDAFVPQEFDMNPEDYVLVNKGRIFTPFGPQGTVWRPSNAAVWPPSSYDPVSKLMYVCAVDSGWGKGGGNADYPITPGQDYSGSISVRTAPMPRRGVVAALDITTNKLKWQQQWVEPCYSGLLTTAGGLLFVGRSDGRFQALDKTNGLKLWEFQTDGGVNAPASMFEYKGKQYVVVLAGGTGLVAGSKRSDGLWLFALDGKVNSMPRGSADPAPAAPPPAGAAVAAAAPPPMDVAITKDLFTGACATCHGEDGKGTTHGPGYAKGLTHDSIVATVSRGRNDMPAFGASLTAAQIEGLTAYVLSLTR